jgi:glutamyl-tRNA reductase
MVLGAGETSELAARHLIRQGITRLFVANRSPQRGALETFSVGLVHKLCHMPTVNLKRAFREGRGPEYVQLVRHLFALDP